MIKLSAPAIVSQLHRKFGPISIREFSKSLTCLNKIEDVHAHAQEDSNT